MGKRTFRVCAVALTAAAAGAVGVASVGAAASKPSVLCWNKSYPGPFNERDAGVRAKPKKCLFFEQGGTASYQAAGVISMNWKSWGGKRSRGEGIRTGNMGFREPARVVLSKPVRNCEGDVVYSKVKVKGESGSGGFRMYTCPHQTGKDLPGTDGGPAERGCKPVIDQRFYVGATNMACSNARKVAKRGIRGNSQRPKWNCTGVGSGFGHCHGSRGRIAHWAVND